MHALQFGNYIRILFHVGVEHALLLKIMRHGVLRQKWRLEPDFGSDPFPFAVRSIWRMVAASPAAELRAEVGALDLIELLDFLPGGVAHGAGNVDFEMQNAHSIFHNQGVRAYTFIGLAVREPLVQHEVHNHTGHTDVHP
jgi:hypothetical protein